MFTAKLSNKYSDFRMRTGRKLAVVCLWIRNSFSPASPWGTDWLYEPRTTYPSYPPLSPQPTSFLIQRCRTSAHAPRRHRNEV